MIWPQNSSQPPVDPRLQPTPDYGTLGTGADIALHRLAASPSGPAQTTKSLRLVPVLLVIVAGALAAVLVENVRSAGARRPIEDLRPGSRAESNSSSSRPASEKGRDHLDRMKPQEQAETLLELAVGNSDGAVTEIASRVDRWQGKVDWSPQLANLTTAALNSSDMHVRESGLEVQLVAYGLTKTPSSLDTLITDSRASDHSRKIWALWSLGAMANRGVDPGRVVEVLAAHLKDSDEDSRRWTVEALALVGTNSTIPLLLRTMHDDPSPLVRERAACSLAESGMLTHEQRFTAVPQLINDSDDPSLDAQTHAWAFQALGDITGQRLPHDSAAWRNWYSSFGY